MHRPIYEARDCLNELKATLEAAGVDFVDENSGGAGVRLRGPDP